MNFDELKKQWDNQNIADINTKIDFERVKEVRSIIDNVRKVMKKDFFFQLTAFPLLLLYPYIFNVNTPLMWFVVFCYVVILVIPIKVLFSFFKQSYKLEYNSAKNLSWFYYNYKFSIELFRIYNYISFVLVAMFIGIVYLEKYSFETTNVMLYSVMMVSICLLITAFLCVWMTKFWINKFYSKPLAEIKRLLDDLEG